MDPQSSDSEDEPQVPSPRPIPARQRAQRAIWQDYVASRSKNLTKDEIKAELHSTADEVLSVKALMAKHERDPITAPREYQLELFERAKQQNIIAVLDTGSGKTHISVLLLRHAIEQELEDRASGKPHRISFFVVDSVALVMQQHSVLSCNLSQNVDRFCGAMGTDLWAKQTWDDHFSKNMVIVVTAEVLVQCLFHSFISIEQINLLIFDEAHHAKKNHPYARIVRDFYLAQEDKAKRPKIFGMTASPIDVKADDFHIAAAELETLLQCQIATTSDLSLLQKFVFRPVEREIKYDRVPPPYETPFHVLIRSRFGHLDALKRSFVASKETAAELGEWPADFYWSSALSEAQASRKKRKVEVDFNKQKIDNAMEKLDKNLTHLQEAADFVKDHSFGEPTLNSLSSKVVELHKCLQEYFQQPTEARCIVFVERRHTARLLCEIFERIGGPYLKPGTLTGTNKSDEVNITFKQQVLSLQKFRNGEVNCLFATSIAEEGLDIPACNLVVRFDLYKTMIQYVQSRGRARHRDSKFIYMIEEGNNGHLYTVHSARIDEQMMRSFCKAVPEDRLLKGNDDIGDLSFMASKGRSYTEQTTGAKLTYESSLVVLAHFVASLPSEGDEALAPTYIVTAEAGNFICEVILPECAPIHRIISRPERRKAFAKQSAAFDMCIELRKARYLDQNLLPTYTKQLPAFRNAQLAISSKKSSMYSMQSKPKLWEIGRGSIPEELYVTIIDVSNGLDRPHQPIGLLTRKPLHELPRFPLFLTSGKITDAIIRTLNTPIKVSEETVTSLTTFTLCMWQDIWNKTFESDPAKMSYWVAPLLPPAKEMHDPTSELVADHLVDWEAVTKAAGQVDGYRWTSDTPHESLKNRFLVDPMHGGRRWYSVTITLDMKAEDPLPADAERQSAGKHIENILNYSNRLWTQSRKKVEDKWDLDQPVLLAEFREVRQDFLGETNKPEKEKVTKAYICPEPLKLSVLNTPFVAMCLVLPCILHRIESYLVALEAFDVLGLNVDAKLALEAMTKDSDNSGDHNEERINFQRGMGNNYERLEFLGDCFLKTATTIPLFATITKSNEEILHIERMKMINNKNLFNTAMDIEIFKFIRSQALTRHGWYPEGLALLKGKGMSKHNQEDHKHSLGDKTVADVCEAAIGAAFLHHNEPGSWSADRWDNAVTAVTNLVNNPRHATKKWSEYYDLYEIPDFCHTEATAYQLNMAEQIKQAHDYQFKWPKLLRSAFMHPSCSAQKENIPSYQRLEFLGDALLDLACVTHLFYKYPTKDPQWLTEHKMAMVSNQFLGAVSVKLGFHRHMVYLHASVENEITRYVTALEDAEEKSNGAPDYWTSVMPPKCLPDILEAYVGALFVDSKFNYAEVQRFFDEHMKWYFEDMAIYDTFASNHPLSLGCRNWRLMDAEVPALAPGLEPKYIAGLLLHDQVIVDAISKSTRYGKVYASKKALETLQDLSRTQFKAKYGCDCGAEDVGEMEQADIGTPI